MSKMLRTIFSASVALMIMALVLILFSSRPVRQPTLAGSTPQNTAGATLIDAYPVPNTPSPATTIPTPAILATETSLATATPFATPFPTTVSELPRGMKIIYSELRPEEIVIWVASTSDVSQRKVLFSIKRMNGFGIRASVSPDGLKIGYTFMPFQAGANNPFDAELWVADVQSGEQRQIAQFVDIGRYRNYPVWSPNSQSLVVMRRKDFADYYTDSIVTIDVKSGKEKTVIEQKITSQKEAALRSIYILDWSSDAAELLYQSGSTGHVELWSVNAETLERTLLNVISEDGVPRCYEFSSDKRFLACAILPLVTSQETRPTLIIIPSSGESTTHIVVGMSSDPIWKKGLAAVSVARGAEVLTFMGKDTLPQIYMVKDVRQVDLASWSEDNAWLAAYKDPESGGKLTLLSGDGSKEQIVSSTDGLEFIGWLP